SGFEQRSSMTILEYNHRFDLLDRYALDIMQTIRSRVHKFVTSMGLTSIRDYTR
ncbi:hypothetical protein HAX54_043003, partial [Datura stramonium]|nr:hypothetical protein [Datura stramonium]